MSEVMRWKLKGYIPGVEGASKALFQPWVVPAEDFDRLTAECDGLQLSLNTADQTIDDLNSAVSRRTQRVRELEVQLASAVDALNEVVKSSVMHGKPFEIATLALGELSASSEPA